VIVVALGVAVLVLLVLLLLVARHASRVGRRLGALTRGAEGGTLEAILDAHLDRVDKVSRELDELAARSALLEATQRRAVQRIGLVRYNPFEDTGGNQSFAIALLDATGDGLVMSSLHSRTGTRVYAKAVVAGASDTALSDEESEALRVALAGGGAGRRAG
jgi:hypothetical protein